MCGIVGYIGTKKASPILLSGLSKLEYRGYDSAGISTIEKDFLSVMKDKGRVENLSKIRGIDKLEGTIGIAHTRWATHGKPSKENSHPHQDNSKTFSVVHNGIIENYNELREFLTKNGYTFYSQTDTEVIPNLIHYYYSQYKKDDMQNFLKAVRKACLDFKGSFAIEVISKLYPENMIVVRQDSPLVIGNCEDEKYLSSDIPAILPYTRDFYLLNDLEFVVLSKDKIEFYDKDLNKIEKEIKEIEWDAASSEKDGYDDYMLKEIYEQPAAIKNTIDSKISLDNKCEFNELNFTKKYLQSLNKIYIVACGTAMHAGLAGKNTLEKLCRIPTEADIASEFRYRDPIIDNKTLCIFISQSGETADTIAALKLSKEKGAKTLAITNVEGSSITREADFSIYTHAGPEIAVASTKAYTCQVVLMNCLAIYFAEILESSDDKLIKSLKSDILDLPKKIKKVLECDDEIKKFAKKMYREKDAFFIGRGVDETAAREGSLKLKEISYIHAESYAAGELKHGPIALIEKGVTVIGIMTDEELVKKTISNIQEVITRGAKTLIITNQKIDDKGFDKVIEIPKTNSFISPVLSIIPLQLLSYYISKYKGLDVDKPRNLAKSVTVE
ncbi:MAG: glutamine--fructose-6-phosphate transaminase (isomerizing) [Clostridia bacterium]|nr:glutamine--fructose-6-phosphate transaminase (isomerizing) [Clostridia bacterium]